TCSETRHLRKNARSGKTCFRCSSASTDRSANDSEIIFCKYAAILVRLRGMQGRARVAPEHSFNSQFPFWYPLSAASQSLAQYYFQKTLQFSPTGECRINSTYN